MRNVLFFRRISFFKQYSDVKFLSSVRLICCLRSAYGVLFVLLARLISYADLTSCLFAVLGVYIENKTELASGRPDWFGRDQER